MLLTGICIGKIQAQNDPVLAGMILLYTDKAQKELKNQEKVMMLQTTGHIWTKEEVQGYGRPAKGVQQVSGFFPVHRLLCRTDLWLLSRNLKADGQYGRFYQAG